MTDTATRLLALITGHFGAISTAATDPLDAEFIRDLTPDSLDVVEVLMAIEDEFQITIGDDEAEALSEKITIREIVALVEGKLPVVTLTAVMDGPNGPEFGEIIARNGVAQPNFERLGFAGLEDAEGRN